MSSVLAIVLFVNGVKTKLFGSIIEIYNYFIEKKEENNSQEKGSL